MEKKKDIVYLYGFSTRKQMYLDNLLGIVSEQAENNFSIAIVLIHDGYASLVGSSGPVRS